MYIFGYGSIINLDSAMKTLKREIPKNEFQIVTLKDYKRQWSSIEKIKFENENEEMDGVFLNLKKQKGEITNGVIIKINEKELNEFKKRERNYDCIQLSSSNFENLKINEPIYAFMTTKKSHLATEQTNKTFIPQNYINILQNSLEGKDQEFVNLFNKSLKDYPFKIKKGKYVFTDPIQSKAVNDK